jgi:2-polyprenyl-3-methyl-5-hydroxy-6-metoxy-1,4-benzoquinol methylase
MLVLSHDRSQSQPGCAVGGCSVCEQLTAKPIYQKFSLWMYQCNSCHVAFTHPMITQDRALERYSQRWFEQDYLPSYGVDPQHPSVAHLAARHNAELAPAYRFRQINRLLDVGAGAGLFLASARVAGWQVEGVEIAEYGPMYARQHFGLDLVHGTIHDAGFPSEYFDVVMLQDTIEHVTNPRELLQEANRILRPGGAIILSTPNFDSLGRRLFGVTWALMNPLEHLHLFNMRAMLQLFEVTGFAPYRLETDVYVNPNFVHGEQTRRIRAIQRLLSLTNRPQFELLLYKLSLGDKINAIAVKQR